MPEDGKNTTETCSIHYEINVKKKICLTIIIHGQLIIRQWGKFHQNNSPCIFLTVVFCRYR